MYKILRAIILLFVSNFFQLFLCDGKLVSLQLYLFMNELIFVILCRFASFHLFFLPFLIFCKRESKGSSVILFVSLPIIISMSSLVECIVRVPLEMLGKKVNCNC